MSRLGLLAACLAALSPALGAAPASAEGPYEPNESAPAAAGPLLFGQTYSAALESSGDHDFYFFYVTSPSPVQASVTMQNLGGGGPTADIAATITDAVATPVAAQTFIREGETRAMTATLEAGKYYLEVNANTGFGDSYGLATGGGNGAFGPYSTISSRCARATAATRKHSSRLNRLESKLQRTTARLRRSRYAGPRARSQARLAQRKARHKVVAEKRARRAAQNAQQPWCSISP